MFAEYANRTTNKRVCSGECVMCMCCWCWATSFTVKQLIFSTNEWKFAIRNDKFVGIVVDPLASCRQFYDCCRLGMGHCLQNLHVCVPTHVYFHWMSRSHVCVMLNIRSHTYMFIKLLYLLSMRSCLACSYTMFRPFFRFVECTAFVAARTRWRKQ